MPKSPYFMWVNEKGRALARAKYPDLKVTEIASLCGRIWRNHVSSEEKQVWKAKAQEHNRAEKAAKQLAAARKLVAEADGPAPAAAEAQVKSDYALPDLQYACGR